MRIRRRKRKFGFSISILWVCSGEKKLPWRRQEEKRENQSEKLLIFCCWIWELKVRFLCVNFGEMEMEMELQGLQEKTETRDESEKWLSLSHTHTVVVDVSFHIISYRVVLLLVRGGRVGLDFTWFTRMAFFLDWWCVDIFIYFDWIMTVLPFL